MPLAAGSSSRMHVMNHNWSAMKQRLNPQSVAEISRHSVLPGTGFDNVGHRQGSVSVSHHFLLQVPYRSVLVPFENRSVETTVAEGGQNAVAGLLQIKLYKHSLNK